MKTAGHWRVLDEDEAAHQAYLERLFRIEKSSRLDGKFSLALANNGPEGIAQPEWWRQPEYNLEAKTVPVELYSKLGISIALDYLINTMTWQDSNNVTYLSLPPSQTHSPHRECSNQPDVNTLGDLASRHGAFL